MRYPAFLSVFIASWALASCGSGVPEKEAAEPEREAAVAEFRGGADEAFAEKEAGVLLFLAPECPLCQNYAPALPAIVDTLAGLDLPVTAVVSGTYYTRNESEAFLNDHNLDMALICDTAFVLARRYGASVTPEVVLRDSTGAAVYRGAIDNWAVSLGRKRPRPTAFYLTDAARNYRAGREIDPKTTDAVGCFIE